MTREEVIKDLETLKDFFTENSGTISCDHCHPWFNKDDGCGYMHYCPYCGAKRMEVKE